jgi:hypothetical protein
MRGEDETMDLHSHCCGCHTVSVRRTSSSHACGREEDVRAELQAKRKKNKKKGAKGERQRFRVSTSRLLAQTLPIGGFFKEILFVAKLDIIHRKMSKKRRSSLRSFS